VIDAAEGVRHTMLASMPHEQDMGIAQLGAAVRADADALVERGRFREDPRLPVGALDRPGDQVLETAEDGSPLARRLIGPEAVVVLALDPAPAALFHGYSLAADERIADRRARG